MYVKPQRMMIFEVPVPENVSEDEMYQQAGKIQKAINQSGLGYDSECSILTNGASFNRLLMAALELQGEFPQKC